MFLLHPYLPLNPEQFFQTTSLIFSQPATHWIDRVGVQQRIFFRQSANRPEETAGIPKTKLNNTDADVLLYASYLCVFRITCT